MTSTDQPLPRPPAVTNRRTVSRVGAPIFLERLTISQAVREAIERQFQKDAARLAASTTR